jgi:hypothetical protein
MLRLLAISLVSLAVLLVSSPPTDGASLIKQCRRQCRDEITNCVISTGQRRRACKKQILRRCKFEGLQTCLPPPATTSTTLLPIISPTTTTSLTTTTTTLPTSGLQSLIGTWDFTYTIISTFTQRYFFDQVTSTPSGVPFLEGQDVFGDPVITARFADLGLPDFPYEFGTLDPTIGFCRFYTYNKTGPNTVSGLYVFLDLNFDGSCGSPVSTYAMNGLRTSFSTIRLLTAPTGDSGSVEEELDIEAAGEAGAPIDLQPIVEALQYYLTVEN